MIFCLFFQSKVIHNCPQIQIKKIVTCNVLQREYTGTKAIRCHCKRLLPLIKCIQRKPGKELSAFQRRFFFFSPSHCFVPVASLLNSQYPAAFSSNGTYILKLLKLAYPKSPFKPSIVEFYKQEAWETEGLFQQNKYLYLHFSWSGKKKKRKQNSQVQAGFNSKCLVVYLNSIFISFLRCSERKVEVLSRHKDY